jgi:hypothetical protein
MIAMTRVASGTLSAAAVGVAVVGLVAGVSAYAATSAAPAPAAACHVHWNTHPSAPGSYGAVAAINTTRLFPKWLLRYGFKGSDRVDTIWSGPIDWWYQAGRVVAVKGSSEMRDLPVGDNVLALPMTIRGTPSGTPWFTVNGRVCAVSSSTAITPTATTPTTTTTTLPTTTTTTSTPTTSTPTTSTPTTSTTTNDTCVAGYRILWQTATQFEAVVSFAGNSTLFLTTSLRFTFSGDEQVTELTADTAFPGVTWAQSGPTVTVSGYPNLTHHGVTFTANHTGVNGPPLFVGDGFSCPVTFFPAPTTTTTTTS